TCSGLRAVTTKRHVHCPPSVPPDSPMCSWIEQSVLLALCQCDENWPFPLWSPSPQLPLPLPDTFVISNGSPRKKPLGHGSPMLLSYRQPVSAESPQVCVSARTVLVSAGITVGGGGGGQSVRHDSVEMTAPFQRSST